MAKVKKPSVFVSFNHSNTDFVDCLEPRLSKSAYVVRFEAEVPKWGSFKEFMDTIQAQDFAVLIISDAYLKSYACMYEVLQAMSNPCWKEKTVFVLMQDCKPLSSTKIISYINYWADKCLELEASLKKLPKTSKGAMPKQLRTMKRIRDSIGDFLNDVADSNCPPIYTAIEEICTRVGITPKAKFSKKAVKGASDSMKGFLIKSTLRSHGPMTVAEISEDLGITLQAARHYTRQLLDYNEIKAQRNNIATKGIKYSVLN